MVKLSETLVLAKTRADNLKSVRNLNMWGNELDDVSILARLPNVEVLSLSVNKIDTLRDIALCPKLTELYMRKNEIAALYDVKHLQKLKHLKVLWLCDNPVAASTANYRETIIQMLPNLTKLDNTEINNEERAAANRVAISPELLPSQPMADELADAAAAVAAPPAAASRPAPPQAGPPAEPQDASFVYDRRREASAPAPAAAPAAPSAVPSAASAAPPSMPSPARPAAGTSSSNVLYAVLSLLKELDEESLQIVRAEVDHRLG